MAVRVAVVNFLGITNAAWRIQKETIRQTAISGSITSEFELLAPDESQFSVLQSDLNKLSTGVSAETIGVYMQDGAQLSLQGSLVVSMNGVSGSVVGDGGSGTTALYVLMGVIGGAVGIGGAYYLVKKIYFPRSSPNSYIVWWIF